MSFPNIPPLNPLTNPVTREDAVNLFIASLAFEQLGLSHVINTEAEKLQYALGTLADTELELAVSPTIDELLDINESIGRVLRRVIEKEMVIGFLLEDILTLGEEEEEGEEGGGDEG